VRTGPSVGVGLPEADLEVAAASGALASRLSRAVSTLLSFGDAIRLGESRF